MDRLALLVLLLAMSSIQFGASYAKQIFTQVDPACLTMLRTGLAAIFLLGLWRPWRHKLDLVAWKLIIPYGISLGIMNLLFYLSLQRIPLGIAVALEFTGPLGLSLLSSRQKVDILWVVLAALGIYLITPVQSSGEHLDILGVGLALAAGLSWSFYIVFGKRLGKVVANGPAASLGMLVAALTVFPFGISRIDQSYFSAKIWLMGALVALLSSALPYSLELIALKRLPTRIFGILMSLEPALAAVMGLVFLGEYLSPLQWIAIIAIIMASLGSSLIGYRS